MDYEHFLRSNMLVPIHPLGQGAFGCVYLAYHHDYGLVAVKIFLKDKFDEKEYDASFELYRTRKENIFLTKLLKYNDSGKNHYIIMEYANMGTLNIIAQQPQIPLPSYVLRALMNQILMGMKEFHDSGLVHRDIKCDNILLHSPPGSGLVHAKISDFGFAKYEDLINEQTYTAGTLPYMAPEMFKKPLIVTQKVDIYALGITFYKLITHKYPVNESSLKEQGIKINQMKSIDKPAEITDNLLWNLLSQMLEFDPDKRIIAADVIFHPYFQSSEANADISEEQKKLASLANVAYKNHFAGN
ncbi:MAG: putative Serine/Threonine kinase domain protein [Streblomastix strix]|uniref:Putative Serine/Threonine kinase domain protein n=1 Tax=Streblomastix strix TaxID=222440 RepID=A0A5J4U984_9EUKA|nr:MAG: putative Serine/Threonine kinase domain protein [Streblomastix strix]